MNYFSDLRTIDINNMCFIYILYQKYMLSLYYSYKMYTATYRNLKQN